MLAKAKDSWDQEHVNTHEEKQRYLSERVPHSNTHGLALAALQELCRELHEKVGIVDEERYDIEAKVLHNTREDTGRRVDLIASMRLQFRKVDLHRVQSS
ncbi:hypothetical protein GDO78_021572 [Eleutherodactylus coqui]|uniref:Uncharacterized protein n=1 Tax=Eleutherodactylus coqui TaxID=57060 RepID=A0A8J6JSE8_ELECQ|nr:hypothetical protein GDO78_021572 [Eleutherodactylus coqui]